MPDTVDTSIPDSLTAAFDSMFASAPEPTRGARMEAGTYQAQLKSIELKTLDKPRADGQGSLTILKANFRIVGPPEYVEANPLGTDYDPGWFVTDEKSLKAVKSFFRSLGISANTFTEAMAEAKGLTDAIYEISVTHKPKKDKSGNEVPGQVYENCWINRRLDS